MPRLREGTLAAHRSAVRNAILDAAAGLVAREGLRAVTMSAIAERSGIGRATLYRYFADVDGILLAWHERQLGQHVRELGALRAGPGPAVDRLAAVLTAFGSIRHGHQAGEDAALLHGGAHVARAHEHLRGLVADLIEEAVGEGGVRDDVPAAELAVYCVAALGAAADLPTEAAVRRLVRVTLDGLGPGGAAGAPFAGSEGAGRAAGPG